MCGDASINLVFGSILLACETPKLKHSRYCRIYQSGTPVTGHCSVTDSLRVGESHDAGICDQLFRLGLTATWTGKGSVGGIFADRKDYLLESVGFLS